MFFAICGYSPVGRLLSFHESSLRLWWLVSLLRPCISNKGPVLVEYCLFCSLSFYPRYKEAKHISVGCRAACMLSIPARLLRPDAAAEYRASVIDWSRLQRRQHRCSRSFETGPSLQCSRPLDAQPPFRPAKASLHVAAATVLKPRSKSAPPRREVSGIEIEKKRT